MPIQRFATTATTTNATPTVLFSVPIPETSSAFLEVDFQVNNSTLSTAAAGKISAVFTRPTGGNVIRATGNGGLLGGLLSVVGNFTTAPTVELVANTTTQTADFRVTGFAATTLTWKFTANARRN